jgi:transcriptional regulator with XRE-family HTH domain
MDVVTGLFSRKLQVCGLQAVVDVPCCSNHTDLVERTLTQVGNWVARRRLELRLDAAEVARTANVDPKTLASLEKGERWPRDRSRASIEHALGWATGSLAAIRAGGDPTAIASKPKPAPPAEAEPAGPKRSSVVDYSALIAALAVDAEDLLDLGRNIDTLIDTNIDVDDTDEVENLVGEVETLISDVDSLVTDIDEFVDVVNNYAKKIVGIDRLQRMKRETRRFRRGQILQQYGAGLSVESNETSTETKEARHGVADKTQPDAQAEGNEVEEAGPPVDGADRRSHSEANSRSDRDLPGTDNPANSPKTGGSATKSGDHPVPSEVAAAAMTDAELKQAAASDPLWADYIQTKRPELVDWDF